VPDNFDTSKTLLRKQGDYYPPSRRQISWWVWIIFISCFGIFIYWFFSEYNNSFLLVPGERAGRITATTTEEDLKQWYGRDNVRDGEGLEGTPVTVVFPEQPKKRIIISWHDAKRRDKPYSAEVWAWDDGKTRWRFTNGVSIGTSAEKLTKLNGGSFKFIGFFCCYEGTVVDWRGGEMRWVLPNPSTVVRVSPSVAQSEENEEFLRNNLLGCDAEFLSDSAAARYMQLRVSAIGILFDPHN
jgi:hypothetical protein